MAAAVAMVVITAAVRGQPRQRDAAAVTVSGSSAMTSIVSIPEGGSSRPEGSEPEGLYAGTTVLAMTWAGIRADLDRWARVHWVASIASLVAMLLCFAVMGYRWDELRGGLFDAWRVLAGIAAAVLGLADLALLASVVQLLDPLAAHLVVLGVMALLLLSGWLWLKVAFLLGHVQRSRVLYPFHFGASQAVVDLAGLEEMLLPSQCGFLTRCEQLVVGSDGDDPAQVVAVRGGWGVGKSFLLRLLRLRLELELQVPVVWVDVWRHQTDPDLQLAIYRKLVCHPRMMFPFGWFEVPVLLPLARLVSGLARLVKRMSVSLPVGAIDVQLALPLPWQEELEQALRGRQVVFVLDEVDRATPAVAQAALTAARRSLTVPGCVVFIPYVPEQIAFKAFSPLQVPHCKDLTSTMMAVLYDDKMRSGWSDEEIDWVAAIKPPGDEAQRQEARPESEKKKDDEGRGRTREAEEQARRLHRVLVRHMLQKCAADPLHQERLARCFAEKYLANELRVPIPQPAELPKLLERSRVLRESALAWPGMDPELLAGLAPRLAEAFHALRARAPERWSPSLRAVAGFWLDALSEAPVPESETDVEPVFNELIARLSLGLYRALSIYPR